MIISTTLICIMCVSEPAPQAVPTSGEAAPRSSAELVSMLRAEANLLEKGPASDFFGALAKRQDSAESARVSDDQAKLILRLDEMARAALRFYLLRGLDKFPVPPVAELAGRVDERAKRVKKAIVAHAEAMVLEAVLTPSQVKFWRTEASVPRIPPQAGRYSLIPESAASASALQPRTYMDYYRDLFNEARWQMQDSHEEYLAIGTAVTASDLFTIFLKADKDAFSNRTAQQFEMLRRLDQLTRDVHGTWILLALGKQPPPPELRDEPPTRAMMERLSESGERLRSSIVAHAEAIALTAILTPSQADESKRRLWAVRGVRALSDPELASLLRLTRGEREEIASRLQTRALVVSDSYDRVNVEATAQLDAYSAGRPTMGELTNLTKHSTDSIHQVIAEYDKSIWESLSKPQRKSLAELLGNPEPMRSKAKAKKPSRPG